LLKWSFWPWPLEKFKDSMVMVLVWPPPPIFLYLHLYQLQKAKPALARNDTLCKWGDCNITVKMEYKFWAFTTATTDLPSHSTSDCDVGVTYLLTENLFSSIRGKYQSFKEF
jgi:hypothetical protein